MSAPFQDKIPLIDYLLTCAGNAAASALATLPLLCMGELKAEDPQSIVRERFAVIKSFAIVANEVAREETAGGAEIEQIVTQVVTGIGTLEFAYLLLARSEALSALDRSKLADSFSCSHRVIEAALKQFSEHTGSSGYLGAENNLRRAAAERSLLWLVDELSSRVAS